MKEEKQAAKLDKDVLNIIRTSMRNNMDLTQIADNKANVLLSLNAIIITFMAPFVLSSYDMVMDLNLGVPFLCLLVTSLSTIYLAVLVLIPRGINGSKKEQKGSPFFFGSFQHLTPEQYLTYLDASLTDKSVISKFVKEDLYFVGVVLARKMRLIRLAFRIFLVGFIFSILLAVVLTLFYGGG